METTVGQVWATHLGLSFERVTVKHGDTAVIPEGMGSFGSRAAMMGGAAVMGASVKLRRQLLEMAAEQLEAAPDDLVVAVDGVAVRGAPSRRVPLPSISVEDRFVCELLRYPYGIHLAALQRDTHTG